jgi:Fic family protein
MNPDDFANSLTGRLVSTVQGCCAFLPNPLPPPNLDLASLVNDVARATLALGELSGIGRTVSNPFLLIRPFMRREAVASSKIEGTVTTLTELLLFEVEQSSSRTTTDTREVMNYVTALENSLKRLDELPVCVRMIKDAHKVLLRNVSKQRGASIIPGEFRTDQNWIGARTLTNARFVPPPPQDVVPAMSDLEKYMNNMEDGFPLLINLSLIHYQFETIHPFPDGNGRVGRLLMPLILCEKKAMSQPLLYLSSYFERNYEAYIENMLNVSRHNRWEDWVRFFLNGVEESANEAIHKARKLQDLQREYYSRIQQARTSALLGRVIESLFSHPALTVPIVSHMLNISYNAAKSNIERLLQHEILHEAEYYYYPKAYVAKGIIGIMNE